MSFEIFVNSARVDQIFKNLGNISCTRIIKGNFMTSTASYVSGIVAMMCLLRFLTFLYIQLGLTKSLTTLGHLATYLRGLKLGNSMTPTASYNSLKSTKFSGIVAMMCLSRFLTFLLGLTKSSTTLGHLAKYLRGLNYCH